MGDSTDVMNKVLNSIPFGILVADRSGDIILANRQAADCFSIGIPPSGLAGLHLIRSLEHIPQLAGELEAYLKKEKKRFTLDAFAFQERILNIRGERIGEEIIFIIDDVTRMKEMEAGSIQSMIEGQENERRRLAREIHDGIAPMISYARLELDAFMDEYREGKEMESLDKLLNIRQTLDSISEDLRDLSHRLIPRLLEEFGLHSAFHHLVARFNSPGKTRVDLYCNFGSEMRMDPETELNLYRCGQELLNNAVAHSHAGGIMVQLIRHEKSIVLMVEDDGTGFDPAVSDPDRPGIGLTNIETRVRAMGGEFIIESAIGRGTTASIEIPQ